MRFHCGTFVFALAILACSGTPRRDAEPKRANAFLVGGVPQYDAKLAAAFEALPPVPRDNLFIGFEGTVVAEALPKLWITAEAWKAGEIESPPVNDLAVAMNAKMHAEGLGYFVIPQLEETQKGRIASLRSFTVREIAIARVDGGTIAALVLDYLGGTATSEDSAGVTYRGTPLAFARAASDDANRALEVMKVGKVVEFEKQPELNAALNKLVVDEIRKTPGAIELETRILRRVKLHEIQHALDYKAERVFEPFAPLVSLMGAADDRTQILATMELSAWTATFVRDFVWWDLFMAMVNAHHEGLPTGYANAFLIDALAKTFDANAEPSLRGGLVDTARLYANTLVLTKQPSDKISLHASMLWELWFKTTLEKVTLP